MFFSWPKLNDDRSDYSQEVHLLTKTTWRIEKLMTNIIDRRINMRVGQKVRIVLEETKVNKQKNVSFLNVVHFEFYTQSFLQFCGDFQIKKLFDALKNSSCLSDNLIAELVC